MSDKWLARFLDKQHPEKATTGIQDPGEDVDPEGREIWVKVLAKAQVETELLARLLYIRGAGAKLIEDGRTGFRIMPIIDPKGKGGWSSLQEFAREKWCLQPYIQVLTGIFLDVRKPSSVK